MAEDKGHKEENHDSGQASSGKNPLLVIIVLLNTIAVGGIGFFQFQNFKKLNAVTTAQDLIKQDMGQEAGGGHGGAAAAGGGHGGGEAKKEEAGGHGGGEAKKEEGGGHGGGGGEHGGGEHGGGHGAAAKEEEVKTDGLLYPLEPFTANLLQSEGPRRYVRLTIVLKFDKETKKEEVDARKPQISDSILSMLNAKKPEELLKKEGKDYLREEIKNAINNFLVAGKLTDVYYTGFQIN